MIARLDGGDAFANGLYDARAFVSEDDRERAFGVLAAERVGICCYLVVCPPSAPIKMAAPVWQTPV